MFSVFVVYSRKEIAKYYLSQVSGRGATTTCAFNLGSHHFEMIEDVGKHSLRSIGKVFDELAPNRDDLNEKQWTEKFADKLRGHNKYDYLIY